MHVRTNKRKVRQQTTRGSTYARSDLHLHTHRVCSSSPCRNASEEETSHAFKVEEDEDAS